MKLRSFDHIVLTVASIEQTAAWYERVLGMQRSSFGEGRVALLFGDCKINLHPASQPYSPHATTPIAGSADICFRTDLYSETVVEHLRTCEVLVELGPVIRTGALGALSSLYVRDPDGNLIEIGSPVPSKPDDAR